MTLRAWLADLVDLAPHGPPNARDLQQRYAAAATAITTAGPDHNRPSWARRVNDKDDVFIEPSGELAGLQLWNDKRGWARPPSWRS